MEMASFSNFLRTLVYIVASYYIIKYLARLLFPVLVKKAVEHAQDNMREQFGQYQNQGQKQRTDEFRRRDGEVIVDASQAAKSRETKKVGEYIDYEEIE